MTTQGKTKWVNDPSHSELLFKVRHLMITNVKGEFRDFKVEVNSDDNDFSNAEVNVTIDASSVFTNNNDRDGHLKSTDFFDIENHKELTFKSTKFEKVNDSEFKLTGLLSIKDVENEVTLNVDFGGTMKDPWGNEKAGFSLEGKINRKDWDLNWNAALETGGVLVSDEVSLSADIQLVKQN